MKVLLAHNFYQSSSPSGETVVYNNEANLLKRYGVDVITYERSNDVLGAGSLNPKLALDTIWSRQTYRELRELIRKEKPDVAHFHNLWYLISPSAYHACKDAGVPVVQTFHNFRVFCANGLCFREGKQCFYCMGATPWRGVVHRCFRDSALYSLAVAITQWYHSAINTWDEKVDAYISLTNSAKERFISNGLRPEKLFVKPNFLMNDPGASGSYGSKKGDYLLYLGRLSKEKGLPDLISAFSVLKEKNSTNIHLKIVGDGPLKGELEKAVGERNLKNIEFLGKRSSSECLDLLKGCRFVVIPSVWFEMFPMVLVETFASGKAILASRVQNHVELVKDGETGILFMPGDPIDLAEKIDWMVYNEDECRRMGKNARAEFEEKYSTSKNFEILMGIYKQATENNRSTL